MIYDYSKLMGKIKEKYKTQAAFAKELGMGESTLNLKSNNKTEWSQNEIIMSLSLLGVNSKFVNDYFFSHKSLEN